ncbi:TetR/AcrR family transcriptional regulator [Telmatospirillum sp.]|uniref:TetR/AcrR family transcriptional regulator n=1 Tax=Telmatospirillum sp. TaxID=2079197 RepID=UPI00284B26D3|nr:TetR/AcrR family transcriptional regulator [Telmatospirillum sp.]MDR3437733.1 TetR/AcrR family transcriptional regulator [Telmatospirillum sp.]
MARTTGSNGPKTMEAINKAGLRLIYEHGYEAMSLRHLAAEVGIQVGSLYNHISTKQDLLFGLLRMHMETLLQQLTLALAAVDGAEAQLRAFVAFHVRYHIARKREVFICYSELRSLDPDHYETIVGMRRDYEKRLIGILERGAGEGLFSRDDAPVTAYGILAMLTGVCTWFRPKGRMTADDLVELYTRMVLNAVGGKK